MANDRMFLECTGCDEADFLYLAKTMYSGYYRNTDLTADEAEKWFGRHAFCDGTGDLANHFKLTYETEGNPKLIKFYEREHA